MYSNIIIEITILSGWFVFCNSCVELSVGLTNLSGLASGHLILYTAPCPSLGSSLSLTFVSRRRRVVLIGLWATGML